MVDGAPVVIKEMGIFADGLIVDTFNTDVSELVLDDLFTWARETFGIRERQSPMRRTFTSAIVVEFAESIENAFGKLSKVSQLMTSALEAAYGWKYKYDLQRVSITVDPSQIPHLRATQFFIERRLQAPYSANRYWSGAPLKTGQHTKMLEVIEAELLA
jgi:hypothetical protein